MVDIILPGNMADAEIALALAMLGDGTREWRKHMGDISDDVLSWQPFTNGHSIGTVLLHMADVEGNWLHDAAHGKTRTKQELQTLLSEETQQGVVNWPAPPARPQAWFYEQQDAVRARTVESFRNVTGITDTRPFRDTRFTLRWLLSHVVAHESYHGGQAVLLHEMYKAAHPL